MPADLIASIPQAGRSFPNRGALFDFLRRELAPYPGRAIATLRVTIACSVVLVLCMTLRIPDAYLSVWLVSRFAMEESSQTLLTAIVFLVALAVGIAIPLVLLTFAMDQPWLRFCLMAAMSGAGLFLRRTFVVGAFGFVIGLIGAMIMTVPDFIPVPELAVRGTLWLWSVFALPIAVAVAANLLIAPSDPEKLLRRELAARSRAAADSLRVSLGGGEPKPEARRLATAGITRLLGLLKSAAFARGSVRAQHAPYGALITGADRLVTAAAALELLQPRLLSREDERRLQRVAADCDELAGAIEERRVWRQRDHESGPPTSSESALPAVVELERALELMQQAVDSAGVVAPTRSPGADRPGLFVADAFENPEYIRYALKGTLAVMTCYVLQSAVQWPGIRTCIITCLIVGLTSEGATIQKGTLRITGALVGALMGFLAILWLIPGMESITSLTLLVAAGTAVAAWVTVGSPRIAYAGVQIAFAFYVCVIQGFEVSWNFYTIRDRLIGILLGNAVITLVFHSVWPVSASSAMWTHLGSALRDLARLATVGSRSDDQTVVGDAARELRLRADREFAAAQQSADQAAFELGRAGFDSLAARERLQTATAEAQSIFLTQLAVASQRPNLSAVELPDALVREVRRFDAVVAESLAIIADRSAGETQRVLPDLRSPLEILTTVARSGFESLVSPEIAAQIEGRLELYRNLVPRVERLASAEFGP